MTNIKYCACTVSVRDRKTYWNEPKDTYQDCYYICINMFVEDVM